MKGQDIVTLTLTFFMGFAAGIYLYFTGFAPQFLTFTGLTQESYASLAIVGERYGGCERTQACGSFQLLEDGTYNYVGGSFGSGVRPVSGTVPRNVLRAVASALSKQTLEQASQPAPADMCASYVDGVDVVYEITYEGVVYDLDTCGTALVDNAEMSEALDNLWKYFTTQ